ncbi:LOW QUALITY PROTEIN: photoreceptor ankyrin repeat protein [Boleophthalmus pectinirostris]|uniref:LOW QUALITY PROTEIN: photoreceptor ankyrin repeat protein n=1 Tax=Boleophthalmus pectinirostris TaxID=150288 RepID=UPI00242BE5B6|nr:LOW QUALITY PROTEIN: photoreceptor ankyrin repeat protein [Boleophthalmus pectinirostris]
MARAAEDPHLGSGPGEDEELSLKGDSDSDSILSDDSVMPDRPMVQRASEGPVSRLYQACVRNEPMTLRRILERGVTRDEVMEVDVNGWSGLMVACCKGYIDIVHGLHGCPFLDVNLQDKEGNTALMIASQAGHTNTVMYLLNYYSGLDIEIKDIRGFTALIKATITGRDDIVAALVMAGADLHATDTTKGKCAQEWALKTGRYETLYRFRRLTLQPKAEQFCPSFVPEWPDLKEKVAKAMAEKSTTQKLTQSLKNTFGFRLPRDPEDNGVMDHMVRITTSIHSPLVSTGCRPLCPTSPPQIGKKRHAVPDLVKKHPEKDLETATVCHTNGSVSHMVPSIQSAESIATKCCANGDRRGSMLSMASDKVTSTFIPRSMARRNSVFPSGCIPNISVSRPADNTPKKKKKKKKDKSYLEPPKWKYKEQREEKKKEEKKKKREEEEKNKKEKSKQKESKKTKK